MIAGIEYLVANWIIYILLIPFMVLGALLWNWWTDFQDSRRDARRKQAEQVAAEPESKADEENA